MLEKEQYSSQRILAGLIYLRSHQVSQASINQLLRDVKGTTYLAKDKVKDLQAWQRLIQKRIVTECVLYIFTRGISLISLSYIFTVAKDLVRRYEHQNPPVQLLTLSAQDRRPYIKALWTAAGAKMRICSQMYKCVGGVIDFNTIFNPPASATTEQLANLRDWRNFFANVFPKCRRCYGHPVPRPSDHSTDVYLQG